MSVIIENLKEAINGESNAQSKYLLFAEQAKKENLPEVARLFTAISNAEGIHIKNHLRALTVITGSEPTKDFIKIAEEKLKAQVKDTKSNLQKAIDGETYKTKKMYKEFVKNAKKGGNDVAELTFFLARKAEKIHARIYTQYLKMLEANKPIQDRDIFICKICGNVEFEKPPAICPICDHGEQFFEKH